MPTGQPSSCGAIKASVVGLVRTRDYVVLDELERINGAQHLDDVILGVEGAVEALRALDIFESVEAKIGRCEDDDATLVTMLVKEKQLGSVKIGASTGESNSVTFEASASARSLLGHGETSRIGWSESRLASQGREVQLSVAKSHLRGSKIDGSICIEEASSSLSGQPLRTQALRCAMAAPGDSLTVQIANRSEDVASSKLSARYSKKIDHRDSPAHPATGYACGFAVECAGLLEAAFAKFEAAVQRHVPILRIAVASFAIKAGAVIDQGAIFAPDKFYLDKSLRAFTAVNLKRPPLKRENPSLFRRLVISIFSSDQQTQPDLAEQSPPVSLGGTLFYSALAMLSVPIAPAVDMPDAVRAHLFVAAGNLGDRPRELAAWPRALVGIGLSLAPQGLLRLEINYAALVKAHPADLVSRFHFALSADFDA